MTYGQPVDGVGVYGVASATGVLLVTGTVDDDGVLEGSYEGDSLTSVLEWAQADNNVGIMHQMSDIPFREASRGRMSKMSMPCIFPISSRRSRPVAWR